MHFLKILSIVLAVGLLCNACISESGDTVFGNAPALEIEVGPLQADKSKGEWTLVVIPDTQHYTANWSKAKFDRMDMAFDWLVDIRDNLNIQMVQGLGDITEWNQDWQWWNGKNAWAKLEGHMPFMPVRGNHDDRNSFNYHFPISMFEDEDWYGDDSGTSDNNYFLMTIGNEDYMFLQIQPYDPYSNKNWDGQGLYWSKKVLDENTDRKVIIATHDTWHSKTIPDEVLSKHNNIILSNSGHSCAREQMYTMSGPDGNVSYNFVTDYQCDDYEVMLIRYYIFKPMEDIVYYYTYSPFTKKFETDPYSQGTFPLEQKNPH